jgi:hypothetical protein
MTKYSLGPDILGNQAEKRFTRQQNSENLAQRTQRTQRQRVETSLVACSRALHSALLTRRGFDAEKRRSDLVRIDAYIAFQDLTLGRCVLCVLCARPFLMSSARGFANVWRF